MSYRSNFAATRAAILRGVDEGLKAAAENVTTKIKARLDRGYTTGAFSHHARGVAGRVMYTEAYDTPTGGRAVTIGTSKTDVPYELYWELGHQNVFTRQYERVEIWRPTLEQNRDLLGRIIARNVARYASG